MEEILIISTGGTFNKYYEPSTGTIAIDTQATTLQEIADKWRTKFSITNIIGKDSLEMDDNDRALLLRSVSQSKYDKIIVVHGTDTMDKSAQTIAEAKLQKRVIFTGAMTPYRVDKVEATANLAMALGFLGADIRDGVYISMNGIVENYKYVTKNRDKNKFEMLQSPK